MKENRPEKAMIVPECDLDNGFGIDIQSKKDITTTTMKKKFVIFISQEKMPWQLEFMK